MSRRIRSGRFEISVETLGDSGTPAVLVHSSGMTSRQWKHLADRLAGTHRVFLPDLIGYGSSSPWPHDEAFHFLFDVLAIEALIDDIAEPVHLVGHSYGGLLSIAAALHRTSSVRSLSLVEPVAFGVLDDSADASLMAPIEAMPFNTPTMPNVPDAAESWLTWFVDYWNGAGAFAALPPRMRAAFESTVHVCHGEVRSLLTDKTPASVWATITVPTLFIRGEHSPIQARRVAEILAAAMPRATLVDIAGAGHMSPLTHAAEVSERIVSHVGTGSTR